MVINFKKAAKAAFLSEIVDFVSKNILNYFQFSDIIVSNLSEVGLEMNEELAFYIAQGISIFTGILAIVMMQLKNMKTILVFQIIVNLTASLNYLLLGGDSGALISLLAIVQSIVMFIYNTRKKKPHLIVVIAFIAAYASISGYNMISSGELMGILPAFAAVCFSVSLVQEKPSVFRVWGFLNPTFWLPYDLFTGSYVMFAVHFGIAVSSVIAIVRLDGFFGLIKSKKGR